MRISKELRKAINAGVRRLCGTNPLAEVGLRLNRDGSGSWTPNCLNHEPEADLGDLRRLADLKEIDDYPDLPGAATLDLYVTSGVGSGRELETNVYVTIKDGKLADINKDDLGHDEKTRSILGRGFDNDERNG